MLPLSQNIKGMSTAEKPLRAKGVFKTQKNKNTHSHYYYRILKVCQ